MSSKIIGFYYKGNMYGANGYFIAFGETEFYFYEGNLAKAKNMALLDRNLSENMITWKKLNYSD